MRHNETGAGALESALETLFDGFSTLPDCASTTNWTAVNDVLQETAARLHNNLPYHHPLYIGQMLKPPHPVARLAYAMAMSLNPNNHALDGGRESSAMEREAVAQIAGMFDFPLGAGHLCGGGTMANTEALWVARETQGSDLVVASAQAHYTHERLGGVLKQRFSSVPVDEHGRMDVDALAAQLATRRLGTVVATVVATLGTTATGAVDPLERIVALRDAHDFHLHVDAAYGGYFTLAKNLDDPARRAFAAISHADSVAVDPHKHGLQPYGCGCILFRDPNVTQVYGHDSPYSYFTSGGPHLGRISLECSRSGAAAVALWATLKLLPLVREGAFAGMLEQCREAALELHGWLGNHPRFVPAARPDLDVVVWAMASKSATESSRQARALFDAAAQRDLHLALVELPKQMLEPAGPVDDWDAGRITCLRACAMKPEHRDWLPQIYSRLDDAVASVT